MSLYDKTCHEYIRFLEGLTQLGLNPGDTVYLAIDMGVIGFPKIKVPFTKEGFRQRERAWCDFVFEGIFDVIGENGTLLTPTFSYDYARSQTPYHHETSPSEIGPFTEYLRTRPDSVRSLHPLFSISGVGKNAHAILDNVGKSAYGLCSPFMRLSRYQTKFLFLGTTIRNMTYFHHLEQLYGVNHMYNKVFDTEVFKDGEVVPGPWLAFVRYLGRGVEAEIEKLEDFLRERSFVQECERLSAQLVSIEKVNLVAEEMLILNPWICTRKPVRIEF
jgi:aminoglycoside 3-N-acetyltransferase